MTQSSTTGKYSHQLPFFGGDLFKAQVSNREEWRIELLLNCSRATVKQIDWWPGPHLHKQAFQSFPSLCPINTSLFTETNATNIPMCPPPPSTQREVNGVYCTLHHSPLCGVETHSDRPVFMASLKSHWNESWKGPESSDWMFIYIKCRSAVWSCVCGLWGDTRACYVCVGVED